MNVAEQAHQAEKFRNMHRGPGLLLLPNAWDAISARIFAAAGFPAIATTSGGVSWALGYADGEAAPWPEVVAATARVVRVVAAPVTADIEAGFGDTPEAVGKSVAEIIQAGAVGVISRTGRRGAPPDPNHCRRRPAHRRGPRGRPRRDGSDRHQCAHRSLPAQHRRSGGAFRRSGRARQSVSRGRRRLLLSDRAARPGDDRPAGKGIGRADQHQCPCRLTECGGTRSARRHPRQHRECGGPYGGIDDPAGCGRTESDRPVRLAEPGDDAGRHAAPVRRQLIGRAVRAPSRPERERSRRSAYPHFE